MHAVTQRSLIALWWLVLTFGLVTKGRAEDARDGSASQDEANERGSYRITDVPAGRYQLKAWHERLPSVTKEVLVPETGELKIDFILGVKNLPPSDANGKASSQL